MQNKKLNIFIPSYIPLDREKVFGDRIYLMHNLIKQFTDAHNERKGIDYHIYIFSQNYDRFPRYYIKDNPIVTFIDCPCVGLTAIRGIIRDFIYEKGLNKDKYAFCTDDDVYLDEIFLSRVKGGLNGYIEYLMNMTSENNIALVSMHNYKNPRKYITVADEWFTDDKLKNAKEMKFKNLGNYVQTNFWNFDNVDYNKIKFTYEDDNVSILSYCYGVGAKMLNTEFDVTKTESKHKSVIYEYNEEIGQNIKRFKFNVTELWNSGLNKFVSYEELKSSIKVFNPFPCDYKKILWETNEDGDEICEVYGTISILLSIEKTIYKIAKMVKETQYDLEFSMPLLPSPESLDEISFLYNAKHDPEAEMEALEF